MTEERRTKKPARWETLARFEGRVTDRQLTRLKALQRKLTTANRQAKIGDPSITTERITDNTLVRVALDLLFTLEPEIQGHTERELTESAKTAVARLKQAEKQLLDTTQQEDQDHQDQNHQDHQDQNHQDQNHQDQNHQDQNHQDQNHQDQNHQDQNHQDQNWPQN